MNWCLHGVHDVETHPTSILFHSENSFQLSGYINVLEQQVLACKKSVFTHAMLLNEFKVDVWCATSTATFIKPIFITTNSHRCVMHILTPLFKHLSNYKNTYAFSSKTVQAKLCAVQTAFSQHNISRALWPCLPDQNLRSSLTYRAW